MSLAKFFDRLRFLKTAWRERHIVRILLRSQNFRFLQFSPPGFFYSPIPDMMEIESKSALVFDRSSTEIPGVDLCTEQQIDLAREFVEYYKDIPFPDRKRDGHRYYFENVYFSYGDAVTLYSMMRRFKPKRIVEIGSGYSSAAMLDVSERFFNDEIDLTFIEPFPDRLLSLLGEQDTRRCQILRKPVQEIPNSVFASLRENDILFVDSSHVVKTYSDVNHIFSRILPALNKGVIVHFHDILWPFEYPKLWLDLGRAWNEAYVLRAFLQYNNAFRILYFNSMMEIMHAAFLRNEMPLSMKAPSAPGTPGNSSLWICKTQ